jgi:hypothetical protein
MSELQYRVAKERMEEAVCSKNLKPARRKKANSFKTAKAAHLRVIYLRTNKPNSTQPGALWLRMMRT